MKKRINALGMIVAIGLTSTVARADVWVSGAVCKEANAGEELLSFNSGVATNAGTTSAFAACPIVVDQNVGTSQQFQVRVSDTSSSNFQCTGVIFGTDGELLATTNTAASSGTGEQTLSFSATTGTSSDDYSYVALCSIPGNSSQLENLRVY